MILPPTHIRLRGTSMLYNEEPPGRAEHPMHFTKSAIGVGV